MSQYDVETGHEWQVDGDTQIAFTLGWSYDKGEPETRGSWSGDDPGVPEHMALESVKVDPTHAHRASRTARSGQIAFGRSWSGIPS